MDTKITRIVILLFDGYAALDVIGPYEVLSRLPGAKIYFTGYEKKGYKDTYGLELKADYSIDEISEVNILLIPGGFGIDDLLGNKEVVDWVRKIDRTTSWTVAVCSGSLMLAEAGILDNKNCTTHWRRKEQLKKYKVHIKDDRFVQDGKIITSAGVSAGIDMALYLVSKVAGDDAAKIIQLGMEYDPKPPFDCGSPGKAPPEILERFKK